MFTKLSAVAMTLSSSFMVGNAVNAATQSKYLALAAGWSILAICFVIMAAAELISNAVKGKK